MKIKLLEKEEKQYTIQGAPAGYYRLVIDGTGRPSNETYVIFKQSATDTFVVVFGEEAAYPRLNTFDYYSEKCRFARIETPISVEFSNEQ